MSDAPHSADPVAGPGRWTDGAAQRPAGAAFVELYGAATRCFGTPDPRGRAVDLRSAAASGWSHYDAAGNGGWGSFAALVVTDGARVAYLDAVWELAAE